MGAVGCSMTWACQADRPGWTTRFGVANPPDDARSSWHKNESGILSQRRSGRHRCRYAIGFTVAVRHHHAVALLVPEQLIDLLNAHWVPLACGHISACSVRNVRESASGHGAYQPIRPCMTANRRQSVDDSKPANAAAPGPFRGTTPVHRGRCAQCGASTLKIAQNPYTDALQCKVCGARQN
jgi:hypothetical protein